MNLLSNLNEFGEENNLICRGKQFDLPSYGYYLTLTDSTLHFSCYFTKLLHSHFIPLLNHFTMQEKCY